MHGRAPEGKLSCSKRDASRQLQSNASKLGRGKWQQRHRAPHSSNPSRVDCCRRSPAPELAAFSCQSSARKLTFQSSARQLAAQWLSKKGRRPERCGAAKGCQSCRKRALSAASRALEPPDHRPAELCNVAPKRRAKAPQQQRHRAPHSSNPSRVDCCSPLLGELRASRRTRLSPGMCHCTNHFKFLPCLHCPGAAPRSAPSCSGFARRCLVPRPPPVAPCWLCACSTTTPPQKLDEMQK